MDCSEAKRLFVSNLTVTNKIIEKYCRMHNVRGNEVDDCRSYVYEKLIDNDYKKIREFKGNSSYKTFITVVITRILIDRKRLSSRKWKPSKKAIEIGKEAVILEELVYCKDCSFEEAYNILTTNHNIPIDRDKAYEIVTQLQGRNIRRKRHKKVEIDENGYGIHSISPEEAAIDEENLKIKEQLYIIIKEMHESLSNEERLLLKMRFEDDISISKIARILKMNRSDVDKKLKAIIRRFKDKILTKGISIDSIRDILF